VNSGEDRTHVSAGSLIGWYVLATGLAQLPAVMAALLLARIAPHGAVGLLLLVLPSAILLIVGGIGLRLRRFFGYYCVYAATFFGGIGGFKQSLIPLARRYVHFGPETEDVFMLLNLVVVAILVWEHWQRTIELQPATQRTHRFAIIGLVSLGLVSVAAGRAMIHRERGQKDAASELPAVGASFAGFRTSGKLSYVSVETKVPPGISLVFSGVSREADIQGLADAHRLTKMDDPEAHKKFLPQVRIWRLKEELFPTRFSQDDFWYVGRLKEMKKVSLQLVYRKSDGRFTAQVFGVLPSR
jgi:hypothetical protein